MTSLGSSSPYAINNNGWICGTYNDVAVLWQPAAPVSIGAARQLPNDTAVYVQDAVVTATTIDSPNAFVESPDRSSGALLVTSQSL